MRKIGEIRPGAGRLEDWREAGNIAWKFTDLAQDAVLRIARSLAERMAVVDPGTATACVPRDYGGRRGMRIPPEIGAWAGGAAMRRGKRHGNGGRENGP